MLFHAIQNMCLSFVVIKRWLKTNKCFCIENSCLPFSTFSNQKTKENH